jgi:hypothetical protein
MEEYSDNHRIMFISMEQHQQNLTTAVNMLEQQKRLSKTGLPMEASQTFQPKRLPQWKMGKRKAF